MRRYISLLLFLSVGLSQKEYDIDNIIKQDGVYIKKFSDEIVNGKVFQMFGEMKVPLGEMKDGKKEGKWIGWYENGQKKEEGTYKDGKEDGLWTGWYNNGQKELEGTFKDGKPDGLSTLWYKNGQKKQEGTENEWTYWNEDGSLKE